MKRVGLILLLVLAPASLVRAADESSADYEIIPDLDIGFLMSQPKLPWGEDPFLMQPGFANVPQKGEKFVLSGVLYGKKSPMAVINGKMVEEGAIVDGRLVQRIGENFVILKKNESEIQLTLPPLIDEMPDLAGSEEGEEAP
jgi:hypothetical protein